MSCAGGICDTLLLSLVAFSGRGFTSTLAGIAGLLRITAFLAVFAWVGLFTTSILGASGCADFGTTLLVLLLVSSLVTGLMSGLVMGLTSGLVGVTSGLVIGVTSGLVGLTSGLITGSTSGVVLPLARMILTSFEVASTVITGV